MDVVIAGGHGQIALRTLRLLAERGDRARGLIRNPDHAADLEAVGAEAVICDLEREDDITAFVAGADAVVFAAGAGPGSGAARKQTVDLGGALKLVDAAKANGIARYVIVSAIGASRPEGWSEEMRPYYEAKAGADRRVAEAGLDHTIVRPGRLTDAPGTGRVVAAPEVEYGDIPRDDVAAVIVAALDTPGTIGKAFDLVTGETPIAEAVAAL
jgi:uncharacterized protein YbjT (DUF2867 family)